MLKTNPLVALNPLVCVVTDIFPILVSDHVP